MWTGPELPELPRLRHLNLLHCNAVDDSGLGTVVAQNGQLTSLQLRSDSLTDAGLAAVARLTALERLDLVDCEGFHGEGFETLLASLSHLQVTHICFITQQVLCKHCTKRR